MIQINALARYFAQNLDLERPVVEYGPTFKYSKVYCTNFNGEYITVEEFIEGTFAKCINNTGEICGDVSSEISLKADAFVHFTYVNFNQQLMVSDIQGVDYWLCDPEIASAKLMMKMTVPFFSVAGTCQRLQLTPSFRHAVVLWPVKPPTYIAKKRKGKSRYYDRAVNIKFKVFGRVHTCYNGSRDWLRKQWT